MGGARAGGNFQPATYHYSKLLEAWQVSQLHALRHPNSAECHKLIEIQSNTFVASGTALVEERERLKTKIDFFKLAPLRINLFPGPTASGLSPSASGSHKKPPEHFNSLTNPRFKCL